ncbi:hypothetical protein [Jannaschia pohangensis]|uniref:hypothetical protein n=1 Tax=Jannaschia pohangensis TaxID=390807 RepID=UPI0015871F65|nr:hypothetical protein [Jannaschia pohangensis]
MPDVSPAFAGYAKVAVSTVFARGDISTASTAFAVSAAPATSAPSTGRTPTTASPATLAQAASAGVSAQAVFTDPLVAASATKVAMPAAFPSRAVIPAIRSIGSAALSGRVLRAPEQTHA